MFCVSGFLSDRLLGIYNGPSPRQGQVQEIDALIEQFNTRPAPLFF
jgi:hypothetical protein